MNKLYKKPKIYFDNLGGGDLLEIFWYSGPHGVAVEALNQIGVGFFGTNGELFAVAFDDVAWEKDHQFLEFHNYRVEAIVKNGKVTVKLHLKKHPHKKVA